VNSDRSIHFPHAAILGGSFLIAFLATSTSLLAQDVTKPPVTAPFIEKHCADCHDDTTRKAGLNLLGLDYRPGDGANLAVWVRVHDRVKAGEMPPKKKPRPDPAELAAFVRSMAATLTTSERAIVERDGRAMQRRLNRYEYENTLRDLLHVPWVQIRNRLPEDGEAHRYNKLGEALDVSHVQMARYMSVADYTMRQAMSAQLERPPTSTNRYYARNEPSLTGNFRPRENGTLPDRHSFPVLDSRAQPDVRMGRAPLSDPATRDREAVGRVSSIFSDAGGYSWGQFRVPVAAGTGCASAGIRSGSAAAALLDGFTKARAIRKRRCITCRCGTAPMSMKSGPDAVMNRSVSMPRARVRAARWENSISSPNRRPTNSKSS
jgi:hypothetical protein